MWSRQRGLLYAWVNVESDLEHIEELWGRLIKNFVWIKEPDYGKETAYYNPAELDGIYAWVKEQIKSNPEFVPLVKKRFLKITAEITPYLEGKKIGTFKELKKYYSLLVAWRSPADSVFLIPDLAGVSREAKAEMLALRKKTQHISDNLFKPIADFMEKECSQYKELFDLLLPSELFSLEAGELPESKYNEIKQRKAGCAIFRGKVYSLEELPLELKKNGLEIVQEKPLADKTIQGACAYKGKVTGKITLVLNKSDIVKVTDGSIVVTEMTTPDMFHVLMKAAAIITDEGGITCHAAIIAREFKKPCVVGTRNATQMLRDGDLVEVDAEKGIIRKIEQ